ncbi:MAG TPA: DMT family transporter [Anaerolineae bacterium]|jgi:drug/metabolite transporter (DMT)-like permease|nr:DMT family transporter [Anaerolineae bacterium]
MLAAQQTTRAAYFILAFGIFCIGFSAIFVKLADLPGSTSGFYRLGIASIALLPIYLARRSKYPPMSKRVFSLAALGGLFFALDVWAWQSALTYTSAASATLLGNTSSIIVALGAWLIFREKLRLPFWTGLFIAFIGVLLVLGADFLTPHASDAAANIRTEGNLLALLGACFYAGYLLTTQHTRARLDTVAYLFLMSAIGAIILLGFTIAQGDPLWGFSIKSWLALLGLALITHVIGWLAISYALGHIRASIVSVTLLGQPVLTALFSIPLLGEGLVPLQIIGGLLALSGIYIVNRFGR